MRRNLFHAWWIVGLLACGAKDAQDTADATDSGAATNTDSGQGGDGTGDDGGDDGGDSAGDDGNTDDTGSGGSGGEGSGDDTGASTGSGDDGSDDTGTALDLYGEVPKKAIEAPEFAAVNRDGGARDREDLLGHPTVLWFYPLASSPG
jgi:hypothetical protein